MHPQEIPQGIDLIYRFDPQGRFTYVNEKARALFDMDIEAILGQPYYSCIQ